MEGTQYLHTREFILKTYEKKGLNEVEEIARKCIKRRPSFSDEKFEEEIWNKIQEYVEIVIKEYGLRKFLLDQGYDYTDTIWKVKSFDKTLNIVKYFSPYIYDTMLHLL